MESAQQNTLSFIIFKHSRDTYAVASSKAFLLVSEDKLYEKVLGVLKVKTSCYSFNFCANKSGWYFPRSSLIFRLHNHFHVGPQGKFMTFVLTLSSY